MKKYYLQLLFVSLLVLFNSCSDDDNSEDKSNTAIGNNNIKMSFTPTSDTPELAFKSDGKLTINWGDNTFDTITNATAESISHTYSKTNATYNISIKTSDVTNFQIEDSRVSNLELGVFPNIKTLTIRNINKPIFDVSKNTKLESLFLTNCNLNSIDLSNNISLQRVYLGNENTKNMNNIENIDLSKNTELVTFDAENNLLSKIDFNNNLKLTTINLNNNKLTSIYLGKNSVLENIYLKNNQLTELVASYSTDLKRLEINNNLFTDKTLNLLFESLSDKEIWDKTIVITGNPGSETCDRTIATNKKWIVSYR